jgi:hypothetical protein
VKKDIMTDTPVPNQTQEQKNADIDRNFRLQEQKFQRVLEQERMEKMELQRQLQEARRPIQEDEDDDSDPYVDHKKLEKKLAKHGQQVKNETQSDIQKAVQTAIQEERKQNWINQNKDFYDVLNQHADKFAQHDPELAETILQMPEGFERQKLVYKNIKALGLHKEPEKQQSIQDKIDANRRSPYYQPGGVGATPHNQQGDFSKTGQKNAYDKMQELKSRLRI